MYPSQIRCFQAGLAVTRAVTTRIARDRLKQGQSSSVFDPGPFVKAIHRTGSPWGDPC